MKISGKRKSTSLTKKNTLKERINQIKIESPSISPRISIDGNPFQTINNKQQREEVPDQDHKQPNSMKSHHIQDVDNRIGQIKDRTHQAQSQFN